MCLYVQANEAHHRRMTSKAPKDIDYSESSSYNNRTALAVGEGNLGIAAYHEAVWVELCGSKHYRTGGHRSGGLYWMRHILASYEAQRTRMKARAKLPSSKRQRKYNKNASQIEVRNYCSSASVDLQSHSQVEP